MMIPSTVTIVMVIIVISTVFISVLITQAQAYQQMEHHCDATFGVNNWKLNETTGTGNNKYYIGQVWECVFKI